MQGLFSSSPVWFLGVYDVRLRPSWRSVLETSRKRVEAVV